MIVVPLANVMFWSGVAGQRPCVRATALSRITVLSGKSLSAYTATCVPLNIEVDGEMPWMYEGDVGSR